MHDRVHSGIVTLAVPSFYPIDLRRANDRRPLEGILNANTITNQTDPFFSIAEGFHLDIPASPVRLVACSTMIGPITFRVPDYADALTFCVDNAVDPANPLAWMLRIREIAG